MLESENHPTYLMLNNRSINGVMHYSSIIFEKSLKFKREELPDKYVVKLFVYNKTSFGIEKDRVTVSFDQKSH